MGVAWVLGPSPRSSHSLTAGEGTALREMWGDLHLHL